MSKQHQKSKNLCNNREELTGKKLSFPGKEPRTLLTRTWYIHHSNLRHLCNKGFTDLTCYGKKGARCEDFGPLRHVAACFKTPTNSSQNLALRHAAACCCRCCLLLSVNWPCTRSLL